MFQRKLPKHIDEIVERYKKDKWINNYYNILIYQCIFSKQWGVSYLSKR